MKDLLTDPTTRGTHDIIHSVAAVASSSSIDSAKKFTSEIITPSQKEAPATYGSYEELVKDKNVDILYIASPHSHHFQNCMLALTNNKPILCEKAFTVNADQARLLYKTAKEKSLFLMEAVWTRYFPLSIAVRKHIQDGTIGEVLRVNADFSIGHGSSEFGDDHRMVNKDLAGGALLDLGVYSLTWLFQTLYHTVPVSERKPPSKITSIMTHYGPTGADESTSMLLEFPRSVPAGTSTAHGIATTSMNVHGDPDGKKTAGPTVRIYGTKGEIQVFGAPCQPLSISIIPAKGNGDVQNLPFEIPGGSGMFWEADEAARCLLAGKLESEGLSWEESTVIMEVMDEVRKQGGLTYPENIETTKYPVDLTKKGGSING